MTLGLDAYLRDEKGVDVMETVFMDENERFSALPHVLQRDVKAFFGTYARACTAADHLLFSAGKMETIDAACKVAACGKLTPEALYIHTSGLSSLPPLRPRL